MIQDGVLNASIDHDRFGHTPTISSRPKEARSELYIQVYHQIGIL